MEEFVAICVLNEILETASGVWYGIRYNIFMNFHNRQLMKVRLNLTPMIDVVFLLIIFFMVVSQYSSQERSMLDLPKADDAEQVQTVAKQQSIIVNIQADGSIMIDDIKYDIAGLGELLGGHAEDKITIRSDKQCQWQMVRPVFDTCRKAGISTPNIAVVKE